MPGRRRLIAAGAGAFALITLGYRAWDRGVFAGTTGPAFSPWDDWRGSDPDGARRPLRAAVLAASPHNTQPWLFAVSATRIDVYADRARHLGVFDPFRREMHLGLGCAIENLVRAARAFGMKAELQLANGRLEPSPSTQPILTARITIAADRPWRDPLLEAVPRRHTNRGPYRDEPIAPEAMRRIVNYVSGPPLTRLVLVPDRGARRELAATIVDATKRIIADPEMSMDSFRWIRTGRHEILERRDGVTIDTSGASPLMRAAGKMLPDLNAATTDRFWLAATRDVHAAAAPLFGMIMVRDRLDMQQAIAAGRAWQQLHLAATAEGVAAQPLNQPVEMIDRNQMLGRNDEFGPALATFARTEGWQPTFVFRLGYPIREALRSPRRPVEDVVIP